MNFLDKVIKSGLIFDGGMGTMLIKAGIESSQVSEYWNLEKPDIIKNIHKAYFDAGADIITTNTFGGSRIKLQKANLQMHVEEINKIAATIARKVAGEQKYVAGDIGPCGEMLQPFGLIPEEEAVDNFAEQANALIDGGVDVFIIETMFDINESIAAIKGIKTVSDLPIIATLTFAQSPTGFATVMGNKVADSMKQLIDNGANVVGANCTLDSEQMLKLSEEIRKSTDALTIVQPNAGKPTIQETEVIYPEDVITFSNNILKMKQLGINIVGGCCGTSPEYITKIREILK